MNPFHDNASHPAHPAPHRVPVADWISAIALVAFWLVARPYRGVRHDATLYLGQTLARLMPERFGSDLFLHSAAQDHYSIFSSVLAPIVAMFGAGRSELVLLACCHALFMLGVWTVSEGWSDRPMRWAIMMFAAALPHTYGGLGEFSYAEPFLTARSIAEPLALLALGQLMRRRLVSAIALICAAAAFHPLITLPAVIVGWIALILRRRTWAWFGLAFAIPLVLAVLGVAPFDGLGRSFDAPWYGVVRDLNAQVFASTYTRLDWSPLAFDAVVLGLLLRLRRMPVEVERIMLATLIAVVALTAVWVIGADVFHNVLLTQLQVWRVYWLMHLLAVMALSPILADYWRRGLKGRWCAAALALAGIAVMSNWNTGWVCLLWAAAALAVDHWRLQVSERISRFAVGASVLAMVAITVKVAWFTLQALAASPDLARGTGPLLVVLGLPLVIGLLVRGLIKLLSGNGPSRRAATIAAATAAVGGVTFGALVWDQRSDWQRRLEDSLQAGPPVFDAQLPPTAAVYWDFDVITPWLLARRGSFFSTDQAPGLVFDRETALEYLRRSESMQDVSIQRSICLQIRALTMPGSTSEPACAPSVPIVSGICHATVHPDYLVFRGPMTVPPIAEWHDVTSTDPARQKSFYLYACTQFR